MATFNQQNAHIGTLYGADTINFGHVQTQKDFSQELKHLKSELEKAIEAKAITGEGALDAETYVKKAILQCEKDTPDKNVLINHLKSAKELVKSVEGLVTVFSSAIATVGTVF